MVLVPFGERALLIDIWRWEYSAGTHKQDLEARDGWILLWTTDHEDLACIRYPVLFKKTLIPSRNAKRDNHLFLEIQVEQEASYAPVRGKDAIKQINPAKITLL